MTNKFSTRGSIVTLYIYNLFYIPVHKSEFEITISIRSNTL
jgi:hypothetical protein